MTILLVTEKPGWLTEPGLLPSVFERWPNQRIIGFHLISTVMPRQKLLMRAYPRGLSLREYPLTLSLPKLTYAPADLWGYELFSAKGIVPHTLTLEDFKSCTQVFYLADFDHRSAFHFEQIREQFLPHIQLEDVVQPSGWATANARGKHQTYAETESFVENCAASLQYGAAKAYFDYNWNANALAVLGRALRAQQTLTANPIPISKFGLQLLYWLRDQEGFVTTASVSSAMHLWKGTGRYTQKTASIRIGLGSVTAIGAIIAQLINAGYITEKPSDAEGSSWMCQLSSMGHALLSDYLHPDCNDPDLPFRLDDWCRQGLDVAKPAMDRYLKTFFGKQLRFWRKLQKNPSVSAEVVG